MNNCIKSLIIKAGSIILVKDEDDNILEFELLDDLSSDIKCDDYFNCEKQAIVQK